MPGVIIFNPEDDTVGFSTGNEQAAGVYLDLEADALYFTDTVNIYQWEGNPALSQSYTWRSGRIRMPKKVNLGAALVEADSYNSVLFQLYADGVLKASYNVSDSEPFRLPGGYLSNIYEIQVSGTDVITGVSVAQNIFDLAAG